MDDLDRWLTSILRPAIFESYGDWINGKVWFEYIGQHSWPHSLYDTRTRALEDYKPARDHMFNYCAMLVVARLK